MGPKAAPEERGGQFCEGGRDGGNEGGGQGARVRESEVQEEKKKQNGFRGATPLGIQGLKGAGGSPRGAPERADGRAGRDGRRGARPKKHQGTTIRQRPRGGREGQYREKAAKKKTTPPAHFSSGGLAEQAGGGARRPCSSVSPRPAQKTKTTGRQGGFFAKQSTLGPEGGREKKTKRAKKGTQHQWATGEGSMFEVSWGFHSGITTGSVGKKLWGDISGKECLGESNKKQKGPATTGSG